MFLAASALIAKMSARAISVALAPPFMTIAVVE
jgi:hypothetical protein